MCLSDVKACIVHDKNKNVISTEHREWRDLAISRLILDPSATLGMTDIGHFNFVVYYEKPVNFNECALTIRCDEHRKFRNRVLEKAASYPFLR